MTESGLPLGLLNQKIFQYETEEKINHKRRPITEKHRWIESLRTTKSLCGEKTVVTICDRESDIFEFFVEAKEIEAKILIRAAKDRIFINGSSHEAHETLWTYMRSWQIECYHRILKSGCKVENCRLETYERLKKYIRLKSIIAFRLFWLTLISRVKPELSCSEVLEEHEWKAMYCYVTKTSKASSKPPTVKEAIRMIAKLGGFLGRKNDGEPGMTYIWRGWEKLSSISKFWLSIHTEAICG